VRIYSFLFLVLFVANSAFAFTVVLKSGKQIQGTLLSEDSETLNLRDISGVTLHFQKRTLDLDAMKSVNAITHPQAGAPAAADKKQIARVYTDADLARLPELSQFSGSSESELPAIARETQVDESKWRKAAASLRKAKAKAEVRWQTASTKCEKARDTLIVPLKKNAITFVDPSDQPADCVKAEELRSQVDEAVRAWDDFTDEARKAGVPWSVID
jgi:hypothetical protein